MGRMGVMGSLLSGWVVAASSAWASPQEQPMRAMTPARLDELLARATAGLESVMPHASGRDPTTFAPFDPAFECSDLGKLSWKPVLQAGLLTIESATIDAGARLKGEAAIASWRGFLKTESMDCDLVLEAPEARPLEQEAVEFSV